MLKKILYKLTGQVFPQEYLCFNKAAFSDPIHIYLVKNKTVVADITNAHVFAGYKPLMLAIVFDNNIAPELNITLALCHERLENGHSYNSSDMLANLSMKMIHTGIKAGNKIVFYEGINGHHRFLSNAEQFFLSLYNNRYHKKPGNVFLPTSLYRQVQIAYSFPRVISLISLQHNGLYNLFPTDLHGQVDNDCYIISLRVGGLAARQVEQCGKILVSNQEAGSHKTAYALGKNHMKEMGSIHNYPFGTDKSVLLGLPVPQQSVGYHELEMKEHFINGIHNIFIFNILNIHLQSDNNDILAHVHSVYAGWRCRQGYKDNYLLR